MRKALATIFIVAFFLAFTWPGPLLYYTGDDLMNLYKYWSTPLPQLVKANLMFWSTFYRPFGAVVYLPLYYIFGFNPRPLYILYYVVLLLNLWLAYRVTSRITRSTQVAAIATLLCCFHGELGYLYYNAGSLYDVFCFTGYFTALIVYLGGRERGEYIRGWRLAVFLVSFICCLNSKEMGATLPAILFLYEVFAHPPESRANLVRWVLREGRGALIAGVCVLAFIPGKLGSGGMADMEGYKPAFTAARYLDNMETFWAEIFYRVTPYSAATPMGILPFHPAQVFLIYAFLVGLLLLVRSRWMLFGLLFFQIAMLPVSFTPTRLGFVLYLPLVGLAIYLAVFLVWLKDKLVSPLRIREAMAMAVLFLVTAGALAWVHGVHRVAAPQLKYSRYRSTVRDLLRKHPSMPHGARLLFVKDTFPDNFDLVFLTKLFYRDHDLFLTQLDGPMEQRIPIDKLGRYDHIFSYEDDQWLEYDATNAQESVRFHRLKGQAAVAMGDVFQVGQPGRQAFVRGGVLLGLLQSENAWTLDNPEFQFKLSSTANRLLMIRFSVVGDTLKQTGPLKVEYFVNDRLLERVTYPTDGERTFRKAIPQAWLNTNGFTVVRIHFQNPYVAPADGARLGFLLKSAGIESGK
jgi:hypothetical protein